MFYHGYRITLAELSYGEPVFLVTKRRESTIYGRTATVSSAIELIQVIEKQVSLNLDAIAAAVFHAAR